MIFFCSLIKNRDDDFPDFLLNIKLVDESGRFNLFLNIPLDA